MEPLGWIFFIIVGIGAIVAGVFGVAVLIMGWWWMIPILCAWVGGWIGFLFGLGLDVIIWIIISSVSSDKDVTDV